MQSNSEGKRPESHDEFELSQGFGIASDKILAKEFDGELTLINLATGVYFAAGGPAVDIWQALASGHPISAAAKRLVSRYGITESEALSHSLRIASTLVGYGLLAATASAAAEPDVSPLPSNADTWSLPWIESYGDMQDLLLLDPVHDVEGGVWPKAQ